MFPRNKKKVKQGDSSSEEQQAAAQLTGHVLPLVHEKPEVEFVTISDEVKVGCRCQVWNAGSCMSCTPGLGPAKLPMGSWGGVCDSLWQHVGVFPAWKWWSALPGICNVI